MAGCDRSWLWRTLVLTPHMEMDVSPFEGDLLPVPLITTKREEEEQEGDQQVKPTSHERSISEYRKKMQHNIKMGIRRLTPREVVHDPLQDSKGAHVPTIENDELSLDEALEIIDLDLSRLMLDDMFRDPAVLAQLRQLLYNYLIISKQRQSSHSFIKDPMEENGDSGEPTTFRYKQGYHEILGLIYLQLSPENGTTILDSEMMRNVLNIYIKLMDQVAPVFYDEQALINWDETQFSLILKNASPILYDVMYENGNSHNNLIWLLRWTKVLFLRELPRDQVLIIWDHLLTFTYPIANYVACLIVTLLLSIYDQLLELNKHDSDHDDIIEMMLHFKENKVIPSIDMVELCKLAGNICELWYSRQFHDIKSICDSFIKLKTGIDTSNTIDPNRQRLENKLRQNVMKSLSKGK